MQISRTFAEVPPKIPRAANPTPIPPRPSKAAVPRKSAKRTHVKTKTEYIATYTAYGTAGALTGLALYEGIRSRSVRWGRSQATN